MTLQQIKDRVFELDLLRTELVGKKSSAEEAIKIIDSEWRKLNEQRMNLERIESQKETTA